LPSSSAAAPALAAAAGSSNPFLAPPQKIVLTPGAVQPQMPWHSVQSSSSRCVCMCVCFSWCVCVCVCVRAYLCDLVCGFWTRKVPS
jgi:hypothetical protein